MQRWCTLLCSLLFVSMIWANDPLLLDVIAYEEIVQNQPEAMARLQQALYEKGVVGLKGVPGYVESVERFIAAARVFALLPEEVKESYAPNCDALGFITDFYRGALSRKMPVRIIRNII